MKCNIYTLNINNYFPEMMEITIPLMKKYANKIGANFVEITKRKFPDWHIHYEKMQIYELGMDCDWNIFFDGDILVNPNMYDITKLDITKILLKDGYRADIKFTDFINDGRNMGISSWFLASSKYCHKIWTPLNITPKNATKQIITSNENKRKGINSDFYQEELALSYNLVKYNIDFNGIPENSLFHSYESNKKEEKLNEIKIKLKEWI